MKVPAGEFKARCLSLMDEVERGGKPITITKRGRPVARLVPVESARAGRGPSPFGCMKGTVKILGDIVGPIDERWEADE